MSVLGKWGITDHELAELLGQNPSLRGMILGYFAEAKLKQIVCSYPEVSFTTKHDDHNRKKKGDLYIVYKGRAFSLESKSLQTAMVKFDNENNVWLGKAQVDGSDRRTISLPDGTTLNTTLLLRGEFDILAVCRFAFEKKWDFVFARNSDLPCSSYKKYTPAQQKVLIASLIPVTMPPKPPFYPDLKVLLDEMVKNGEGLPPEEIDS
jgi:hypothetical protein